MVNNGRKWYYFCFKGIRGPKVNNCGKCLILFVTVFLIGEGWLTLFTLLNTGLLCEFCSEMLLKIRESTFQ